MISALVLASAALLSAPAVERPSVLLITIDTLRPDALGWVAGHNDTPALDRLAQGGLRFPAAVSAVPLTLPSHTSIMTGLLPRHHGVRDNGQVVSAATPLLAERMRTGGYATAAFISGYPLRALFGLDRGFDRYEDTLPVGAEGWTERRAPETSVLALEWMKTARRPWFVWVHYYDPHDPYTPPRAFLRAGPRGSYDGEVAYTDYAVGQLLEGIAGLGIKPLTVMAADHGEGLGEHGETGHGFFVYDSTLVVPLVFNWPGHIRPQQNAAAARLVDIAPTVADLLGLPALSQSDGVSLRPLMDGRPQSIPGAYMESMQPFISYGWAPLKAMRANGAKLIEAPRRELYDLSADPRESQNVLRGRAQTAFELERLMARVEARPEASSIASTDPEVAERLRALGYVGGGSTGGSPHEGLPDPKDHLQEKALLSDGEAALRAGNLTQAMARFDQVLAVDPNNRFATLRSGIALLKKGDFAGAVTRLQRAIVLDPGQAESHYALADALTRSGRLEEAIGEWMETARLQPRRAAAWSNLGTTLARVGRMPQAIAAIEEATRVDPRNGSLWSNLALARQAKGDAAGARQAFEQASRLLGDAFPHAAGLGLSLLRTGDASQAGPWLEKATKGQPDYAAAQFELAKLKAAAGDKAAAQAALGRALGGQPALRAQAAREPLLSGLLE